MTTAVALCACGCGQPAPLSTRDRRSEGGPAFGEPHRFVRGHQRRKHHGCSIQGCDRAHRRGGLCNVHASRARRDGLLDLGECGAPDCRRPAYVAGYCSMHYSRLQRGGALGPSDPLHAPPGSKHADQRGYVHVFVPGHVLAGPKGTAGEHRVVLFDAIGCRDLHRCFWCARIVLWKAPGRVELVVDHLDDNPSNNALWNLVPACRSCNRPGNPPHKRLIFTVVTAIAGWL